MAASEILTLINQSPDYNIQVEETVTTSDTSCLNIRKNQICLLVLGRPALSF